MNPREATQPCKKSFDVVMLATVHDATDDRVFYREARSLRKAGFSVCVMAPHVSSEVRDDIWIEALPKQSSHVRRLLQGATLFRKALHFGDALFIFHDSELFPVALLLRLCGRRVVYDCHENLPMQVLQKNWLPRPVRRLLAPLAWGTEYFGSRLLSGVLVARDSIVKRFPKNRTISVRNYPTSEALSVSVGPPIAERKNIVIYAGGLSRVRGIAEIVEAIRSINVPGTELWLVGPFDSQAFEQEILCSLPAHASWKGKMQHSEVVKLYANAKIGMSTLHPTPSHRNSQPVKLYEYLGAGLPVVASNFPEFSELLRGCGVQVDAQNVEEIRTAVRNLLLDNVALEKMSNTGRERILNSYCWDREADRLVQFCHKLSTPKRPSAEKSSVQIEK